MDREYAQRRAQWDSRPPFMFGVAAGTAPAIGPFGPFSSFGKTQTQESRKRLSSDQLRTERRVAPRTEHRPVLVREKEHRHSPYAYTGVQLAAIVRPSSYSYTGVQLAAVVGEKTASPVASVPTPTAPSPPVDICPSCSKNKVMKRENNKKSQFCSFCWMENTILYLSTYKRNTDRLRKKFLPQDPSQDAKDLARMKYGNALEITDWLLVKLDALYFERMAAGRKAADQRQKELTEVGKKITTLYATYMFGRPDEGIFPC
jgi:hypothetical protein